MKYFCIRVASVKIQTFMGAWGALLALLIPLLLDVANAQAISEPNLFSVFPLSAAAGSKVEVAIRGENRVEP